MKRGAENQLIKGEDDDDAQDSTEVGQGFQKAQDAVLAGRQIRALPKRALAGNKSAPSLAPPPPAASDSNVAPKFGGFSGFGAATPASNPFTFTPPAAAPTSTASLSANPVGNVPKSFSTSSLGTSAFGGSTFATSSFGVAPPTTSGTTSATNNSSAAPSLFSPSSAATKTEPKANSLFNAPTTTELKPSSSTSSNVPSNDDDGSLTYYKSLRGLNVSFLAAITKVVDQDPFIDISSLLENYTNLRTTVQNDFDKKSKSDPSRKADKPTVQELQPAKAAPPKFTMPIPPASGFTGFGKPAEVSTSSKEGTGFTFKPPASDKDKPTTQSLFSFTKPDTAGSSTAGGFAFGSSSNASKLPYSFGSSDDDDKDKAASSTLGPKFGQGGSAFNVPSEASTTSAFRASSSSTASPLFGSAQEATSMDESKDAFSDTAKASAPTSAFGGSTSTFGSPTKAASPFAGFGSGSPPKTTGFSFGGSGSGGSLGNPVGFGFGSGSQGGSQTGNLFGGSGGSSSSIGSSIFGGSGGGSQSKDGAEASEKSTESTPQPDAPEDDSAKLISTSNHDEEGEGEENEETTHAVKCKVFKLVKAPEKPAEWKDMGVGVFRLKKHKETTARRALLRNSSTGKIIINFNLYSGLKPSHNAKVLSFIGYDGSEPTSYRLRFKTEDQAKGLKDAFDRDLASVE